ncbi:MAG TPA: zinc ribbon domain-containing protein [Pyrinomonadaceae bacterium]|nr:zinc ribbon domain-containing protein [Pyrinomonadaceae bacterium]
MYCPTCGSEERQISQYCRACGTDLGGVRRGLERPDTITASAVSAREQISQMMAEKIGEMEGSRELKQVAEDVLPQIAKFLESPEEKRLRRVRAGVVTAAIGVGVALLIFLMSISAHDLIPFISLGVITFLIGIGLVINGLAFTIPRKNLPDRSDDARAQRELEARAQTAYPASQLSAGSQTTNDLPNRDRRIAAPSSVTEHTTHHLNANKS